MRHMQLAGDRLARAYEFLDTVGVRIFGNPSEPFKEGAMGGHADVSFHRPYAGFSRLAGVAVSIGSPRSRTAPGWTAGSDLPARCPHRGPEAATDPDGGTVQLP